MLTAFLAWHNESLVEHCLHAPYILPTVFALPSLSSNSNEFSSSPPLCVLYLIVVMFVSDTCHRQWCVVIIIDFGFIFSPPLRMCTRLIVVMLFCPCVLVHWLPYGQLGLDQCLIGQQLLLSLGRQLSPRLTRFLVQLLLCCLLSRRLFPTTDTHTTLKYPTWCDTSRRNWQDPHLSIKLH